MALLFKPYRTAEGKGDDLVEWTRYLKQGLLDLEIRLWPDVGDPADIEFALVWRPEPGNLRRYPNLKVIFSLGAGVDDVLDADPYLPEHVPVARLVEPSLARQMSEYVIYAVLHFHRNIPALAELRRQKRWESVETPETADRRVGIMGLGVIGSEVARKLRALEFNVLGWSRKPRRLEGIRCFHGPRGFMPFLNQTDILVCVLPLTKETAGIINKQTISALPDGAHVINVGRGGHVVDEDLLTALDSGCIAGAALDCFNQEPLPDDHPYWHHPKILMTPHSAGEGVVWSMAGQIVENIRRSLDGRPLVGLVDREAGY
jgi:glyoxylate/hydroxypyruvate reductase A